MDMSPPEPLDATGIFEETWPQHLTTTDLAQLEAQTGTHEATKAVCLRNP